MSALSVRERGALAAILGFSVLAGVAHAAGWAPLLAFAIATLALAGLAWVVSFATEAVGERFGPAVTSLMQTTLGNLPELFVVLFALGDGQVVVAQASIIGSLLANALLVLGLVIVVGASREADGIMRFSGRLPNDTATLLLVTSFIIVLVGLAISAHDPASHHVTGISTICAVALLIVYLSWAIPYARSGGGHGAGADGGESAAKRPPRLGLSVSIGLLTVAGVGAALVSDWFIDALQPAIHQLGLTEAFAGIVIVAIAGNAVENVVGLVLARKGQYDFAIAVVKNSVSQIAAFLFPVLVLVSLLFAHHLSFALAPVYIGAIGLTAICIWQVTGDGEAAAFEGYALIALYVVVAAVALYE